MGPAQGHELTGKRRTWMGLRLESILHRLRRLVVTGYVTVYKDFLVTAMIAAITSNAFIM